MRNKNKRLIFIIGVIITTIFCNTAIYASEFQSNEVVIKYESRLRASEHIGLYSLHLKSLGEGKLEIISTVNTLNVMDELKISPLILQESTNGLTWTDVRSWKQEDRNKYSTVITATYQGTVGRYYRLRGTFTAVSKGITETRTASTGALYNAKAVN